MLTEALADGRHWYRLADPAWSDPLDSSFAQRAGGRWNPPGSFKVLYLNGDVATARANLALFIQGQPYEPEDLRDEAAPVLVTVTLPDAQTVCDARSDDGLVAVELPTTYPTDSAGKLIDHAQCQPVGLQAYEEGLAGVSARCARMQSGGGEELAWFDRGGRVAVRVGATERMSGWYW